MPKKSFYAFLILVLVAFNTIVSLVILFLNGDGNFYKHVFLLKPYKIIIVLYNLIKIFLITNPDNFPTLKKDWNNDLHDYFNHVAQFNDEENRFIIQDNFKNKLKKYINIQTQDALILLINRSHAPWAKNLTLIHYKPESRRCFNFPESAPSNSSKNFLEL